MTIKLQISKDLEARLTEDARKCGLPPEEYTVRLLERHVPTANVSTRAVDLLQSWIDDGDEAEQRETSDFLVKALDEDRMSNRKLFPPELKGISW